MMARTPARTSASTAALPRRARAITGWHISAIFLAFFGTVIAVNMVMARLALSTFGGTVVDNSFVASQHFNRWIAQGEAARALGWRADVRRAKDGVLAVQLSGADAAPLSGATLSARARHPLGRMADRHLQLTEGAPGDYRTTTALPQGRWQIILTITHGGRSIRMASDLT